MDESIKKKNYLKKLTFTNKKLDISETGTVSMTVDVNMKDKLVIYDDVDAVVDGVIEAVICQKEKEIDSIKLICPAYGISSNKTIQLNGMCLYSANKEEKYTIKFRPVDLWAIERQSEVDEVVMEILIKNKIINKKR